MNLHALDLGWVNRRFCTNQGALLSLCWSPHSGKHLPCWEWRGQPTQEQPTANHISTTVRQKKGCSVFVLRSQLQPTPPCLFGKSSLLVIFQWANSWALRHFLTVWLVQSVPGHRRKAHWGGGGETANRNQMPGQNLTCDSAEQSRRTKPCRWINQKTRLEPTPGVEVEVELRPSLETADSQILPVFIDKWGKRNEFQRGTNQHEEFHVRSAEAGTFQMIRELSVWLDVICGLCTGYTLNS